MTDYCFFSPSAPVYAGKGFLPVRIASEQRERGRGRRCVGHERCLLSDRKAPLHTGAAVSRAPVLSWPAVRGLRRAELLTQRRSPGGSRSVQLPSQSPGGPQPKVPFSIPTPRWPWAGSL